MNDRAVSGMKVLVTGASGFLGPFVVAQLEDAGCEIRTVGRQDIGDIGRDTDWRAAVEGMDAVVHLAGRAHVMRESAADPLEAYREVNLYGTVGLAKAAAAAGVKRFVFMSSIKVMGEIGIAVSPYYEPEPMDPYAVSKLEAELALRDIADETGGQMGGGMEVVILRPPLVYGVGVKGNFLRLLKAVQKGIPLPFGLVDNRRSLIFAPNLADAVRHGLTCRPDTYHPKDTRDLSTRHLIRLVAWGMKKPARLLPVPVTLLKAAGLLLGRYRDVMRLTSSFTCTSDMDGWTPPYETEEAIEATAQGFLHSWKTGR